MFNNSDNSLTTFNSQGKLLQVEYAKIASCSSNTIIILKTKKNAIMAIKNNQDNHIEMPFFGSKIFLINKKIGIGGAGLFQDIRMLVKRARNHCVSFKYSFGEEISIRQLARDLAGFVQEFTQTGGVRPFGASLILMGFEEDGPDIYQIDPSGTFIRIKITAIGNKANTIKKFLLKRKTKNLNLKDSLNLISLAVQKTFECDTHQLNLQFAVTNESCFFKILTSSDLKVIQKPI